MKATMSYIEISALAQELDNIENARVDKIYQPTRATVLIQMYNTTLKQFTLQITLPNFITISKYTILDTHLKVITNIIFLIKEK